MGTQLDRGLDPYYGSMLPGDVTDTLKIQQFATSPDRPGATWWENLATFGIGRYIDNRFGPVNVAGNIDSGSYGGADGRTYRNTGTRPSTGDARAIGNDYMPMLLVAGAGIALYLALRR